MKTFALFSIGMCTAMALFGAAWAEEDKTEPRLRLELDLVDGSHVIGTPHIESVLVQTSYAKMEIPLDQIRSIRLEGNHETASVDLQNGDRIKGVINLAPVKLDTVFGKVSIGIEHVRELRVVLAGEALPKALRKGLVLYYSFDRDEGGKVTDRSDKKNDGTVHGAKWVADGVNGGACDFDGRTSYIDVDYDPACGLFPANTPFSVSAWFRTQESAPIEPTIVSTHMAGAGGGYMLCLDWVGQHDGRLRWLVADHDGAWLWAKKSLNDGRWHHVLATWSANQISLYQDGELQGSQPTPGDISYPHRASFRIGHTCSAGGARELSQYYFNGQIDEVTVFNRALSEDEVKLIYNSLSRPE